MKMSTTKVISTALLFIFCLATVQAHVANTDSIDKVLKSLKDDSTKVDLLIETGRTCFYTLHDKAFDYFQQAITLSKKIDYPFGLANGYFTTGTYYLYVKNDTINGLRCYQLADSILSKYDRPGYKIGLGAILCNYGDLQQKLGNYLDAIQNYIKASNIFDSLNNKTLLSRANANLSSLYLYLQQYDKAEFYALQVIRIAKETNDLYYTSLGNISLASTFIAQEKYKEAYSCILKAKEIAERNNYPLLSFCYSVMGQYYGNYKKDYALAISDIKKAIEQAKLIGDSFEETENVVFICEYYFYNKQFKEAKINALRGYELSHTLNYSDMEQRSLNDLAQAEAHFGEYSIAYIHLLQSTQLKESVFKDKSQKQINYLGALYQSEKKGKEINQLQNEKQISKLIIKRRDVFIYALFLTMVLLIVMSFLLYRNIRNKHIIVEQDLEIERQKTKELEKEHQINAAHAVLQGEETERQRIARDLHDGLGGLLSGVKLKLTNIKGNYVLPEEYVNRFDNALGLLDNSIGELRRVAHNMMPESLVKYGLKDALQDFCYQIDNDKKVKIHFQFFGEEKRVESSIETNVFRIAQELINNSLKHAEASELMVQLILKGERVHLTVQDNGKGFDITQVDETKSSGLRNIRSRVDTFNGRMDIISNPGKGTEVIIEFNCL
jgi:two-component system, NarL family, sensor kinase